MSLPTNLVDDILDSSENEYRVYDIVDEDGNVVQENVHLVDKTVYTQEGSQVGATLLNNIATLLNALSADIDAITVVAQAPADPQPRTLYLIAESNS